MPTSAPGSAVVRVGFPLNAAVSTVLAMALLYCAARRTKTGRFVVAATLAFEAASLTTLILTRTGNVLGWSEPVWTRGADQTRAVEVGALLALAGVSVLAAMQRRSTIVPAAVSREDHDQLPQERVGVG